MVTRTGNRGLKEWGFHEEPPRGQATKEASRGPAVGRIEPRADGSVAFTSATTGKTVILPATSPLPLLATPGREAARGAGATAPVVGAERRLSTLSELTCEVFRLKREIASGAHDDATKGALARQLVVRQGEWVMLAKMEKLPEPTGKLDPIQATPKEIATAFLWSEAGGVIPRAEIERDGGRSFRESIRDALTLRLQGFDAMLDLHRGHPSEQKALLLRSLETLKVPSSSVDGMSVEALQALRQNALLSRSADALRREREAEAHQLYIGVDGFIGTADKVDAYEREKRLEAANPGTTLGSIFATYLGAGDIERMRAMGNAGNALEGIGGGAGQHVNRVAEEREPGFKQRARGSDFNQTGKPKYQTREMSEQYRHEEIHGNHVWPSEVHANRFDTVRYLKTAEARAPYKIEVREVAVEGGRKELRLVDAGGKPLDTRTSTNYAGEDRAIFVMNASGEIFASTYQKKALMHHSSLAGGAEVAAAGELVVENGKLVAITTSSGHYRPTPEQTKQFLHALRERGLNLAGVRLHDASTGTTIVLEQ